MGKEAKKAAQAATETKTTVVIDETNIEEQIRDGNLQNDSIIQDALADIEKEKDERKKEEAKRAIRKFQYKNLKALLELKKRRKEDKATKDYLAATKENFDGYKSGKMTIIETDKKDAEAYKEKSKAFGEADKWFSEQLNELKRQYPGYYSYEWDHYYA